MRVLHYDVMDGHFVPNLTFGPVVIHRLAEQIQSQFDVHLMVTNPDVQIEWFDLPSVRSITVHYESSHGNILRDLNNIRSRGKMAGVTINPPTSVHAIDHVLELADLVLVMTVYPGLAAQKLLKETLPKIEYFVKKREIMGYTYKIQVDGGVNADTLPWVRNAGADEIVSGSAIFLAQDPAATYQQFRNVVNT